MRFVALILLMFSLAVGPVSAAAETSATNSGTLVLGVLSIESSYIQDTERPAQGVPDTVQFWIGPDRAWRIRTYAIDHDIHPHSVGNLWQLKDRPIEFASDHIKKIYGDVLTSLVVLEVADVNDSDAVGKLLKSNQLQGSLEIAKSGFAFWNPDDGVYKSQSRPK